MSYYSARVPDGRRDREAWHEGLLDAASGADLVFLDPDNGIEVPSKPIGRKGSSKYVTWREIQALWDAGCSLLIYQHFRREARDGFARRLVAELQKRTRASLTEAFRTPHVLFLLAAQDRHKRRFIEAFPLLSQRWRGQIEPMELANKIWTPRLGEADFKQAVRRRPSRRPPRSRPSVSDPSLVRDCPACGAHRFKRWPFGWDSHAAHRCNGLEAESPEARKAEFKKRFGSLFPGADT